RAGRQTNLAQHDTVAAPDNEFDGATNFIEFDTQRAQHLSRHTLALTDETEEQMLGADVVVIETLCFFLSETEHFACPLSKLIATIALVPLMSPFQGRGRNRPPAHPGKLLCYCTTDINERQGNLCAQPL